MIPGWLLPGLLAATVMVAVSLGAFLALWFNAPESDLLALWHDSYLWHVIRFSFWQASLSALLSVLPAIFLARALYRRRFPGRLALLRLCAMTLILPVLVAVFGILSVYGRQGWLASLFGQLGLEWSFSPYGLQGILLAHVFFQYADGNAPLLAGAGKHSRRTASDCRPARHARRFILPLCRMAVAAPPDPAPSRR